MAHRRDFLLAGAAISAAAAKTSADEEQQPIRVGVMGLSRGQSLAQDLAGLAGVEVSYLCDVDQRRAESVARQFAKQSGQTAKLVEDFRRILDDDQVDALICAAPNHWHAPATIMACKAGKHVYVEKPCSHNPRGGRMDGRGG